MRIKLLLILIILMNLAFVSGEIMLSQPKGVYNLGDNIGINVNVSSGEEGPLEIFLLCENVEKRFSVPSKEVNLDIPLNKEYFDKIKLEKGDFENLVGECRIKAKFLSEEKTTNKFLISKSIFVTLISDNIESKIEKQVKVEGRARKANGEDVDGFVEIEIPEMNISFTDKVRNGSFAINFTIPFIEAESYNLSTKVYDRVNYLIGNQGTDELRLKVLKSPKNLKIVSDEKTTPGEVFTFSVKILDQTNKTIEDKVGIVIYNTNEEEVYQEILNSGEEGSIMLKRNETPGYWKIEAQAFSLKDQKLIQIKEKHEADFNVINNTLKIKNIGNVDYAKPIKVFIGNGTVVKNINLGIGEEMELMLTAPDGSYNLVISDGKTNKTLNKVRLTGGVIGVEEFGEGVGILSKYPVVWIFLISILAIFIISFGSKIIKKKFYAYPVENGKKIGVVSKKKTKEENQEKKNPESAEHSLVLHGNREDVSLFALNLRNLKKKGKLEEKISRIVKENRGTVYKTSNYVFALFSSITTKTFDNPMIAVKAAREVKEILDDYNKKTENKINYGLALNAGELILKQDEGKIKFTGVGKTLNKAKKVSKISKNELLLSEDMNKKLGSKIKSGKENRGGLDVYQIERIRERDKYQKFIRGFLERQKKNQSGSE